MPTAQAQLTRRVQAAQRWSLVFALMSAFSAGLIAADALVYLFTHHQSIALNLAGFLGFLIWLAGLALYAGRVWWVGRSRLHV